MLWVLKRKISMRRFFGAPKTYVKTDGLENIYIFMLKFFVYLIKPMILLSRPVIFILTLTSMILL